MRASTSHNNFTAGEVTPYLHGRPELTTVAKGLALCRNMKVLPYGGVTRRDGTKFMAEVKTNTKRTRLIPFVFDDDTSYIIELGDLYMRFFTAAGAVQLSSSEKVTNGTFDTDITGWTDASTGTGSISWDSFSQRMVLEGDASGLGWTKQTITGLTASQNYTYTFEAYTPAFVTLASWSLGSTPEGTEYGSGQFGSGTETIDFTATGTTAYISFAFEEDPIFVGSASLNNVSILPTGVLEVTTPFTEDEIYEVMFAQSNDVMFLTHRNHPPQKLTRVTASSFIIADATISQGPFMPINSDTTLTMNINGGTTWKIDDTGTLIASAAYFVAADVGECMLIYDTADVTSFGVIEITGFTSSTSVSVKFLTFIASGVRDPTEVWAHQAIGERHGHPGAVTLHDQRLVYAGTSSKKQNVFGSTVGDFETFSAGVEDDDHYNYNFSSAKQNEIMILASMYDLIAGAQSNEFVARGGGLDDPITPSNIVARPHTAYGAARIQPEEVGEKIAFVQRTGKKIAMLTYEVQSRRAIVQNVSLLSEHLTIGKKITQISYQQDRDRILWCVLDDGTLLGFTYNYEQEVAAWHQHTTGASGEFESVATIPAADADQTWVVVKRTIDGAEKRYIEYINEVDWRDLSDPHYVDSALSYSGAATTTLSGLDHLEGEAVQVYANGENLGEYTVASGAITLPKEVTQAHVGLGFLSTITELTEQQASQDGSSEGRKKNKTAIKLRLYKTQAIQINGDVKNIPRDNPSTTKPELFTGIIEAARLGWDYDGANTIESVGPNPLTMLSISATVNIGNK